MADGKKKIIFAGVAFFVLLTFGFGISEAYLWNNRIDIVADDVACPVVPSLNDVVALKAYTAQWRWRYEDEGFGLEIETVCVTWYSSFGSSRIKYNGELVGSSACTQWGCHFYDCHRKPLYYFEWAASFFELLALDKTGVTMVTYKLNGKEEVDKSKDNIVALSTDKSFFGHEVTIKDRAQQSVSQLYRPLELTDLRWEFKATGNGTKTSASIGAMDPRLLALIAGKLAFTQGAGSYCNQYFWNVANMFILIIFIFMAALVYAAYREKWFSKCPCLENCLRMQTDIRTAGRTRI